MRDKTRTAIYDVSIAQALLRKLPASTAAAGSDEAAAAEAELAARSPFGAAPSPSPSPFGSRAKRGAAALLPPSEEELVRELAEPQRYAAIAWHCVI